MRTPSTTGSDFDSCSGATAWARPFASSFDTRSPCVRLTLLAALCFSVIALTASSASAKLVYTPTSTFAGGGANALSTPTGIAVDNSAGGSAGSVYVTDTANHRIEKFDASGNFVVMFGKGVNQTTPGDVCPVNPGDVCQVGSSGSAAGQFETPTFIAVDPSPGPSSGDVYIADTATNLVQKFDSGGHLITSWGGTPAGGQLNGSTAPGGPFGSIAGITVDSSGNLAVFNTGTRLFKFAQDGTSPSSVTTARGSDAAGIAADPTGAYFYKANGDSQSYEKFKSTGADIGAVNSTGSQQGVAVNPATGDMFTSNGTSVDRYHFTAIEKVLVNGSPCTFASFSGCSPTESFGSSSELNGAQGLAVSGPTGKAYVANTGKHNVAVFSQVVLADVATQQPTVNPTSAAVNAEVDPAGGPAVTGCKVEYGTTTSYGSGSVPCNPDPSSSPPGSNFSTPTHVSASLSNLAKETSYHYRFVVTNPNGVTEEPDQTLTTHNVAELATDPATEIATTSATLNASFTGTGEDVHYYFEWGPDTSYGQKSAAPPGTDKGPVSGPQSLSFALAGLKIDSIYHYRVVATSPEGTSFGSDRTLTTLGRYQFSSDIGSSGAGDGQLSEPADVAVDSATGDIYVADAGNSRVVKFDSSGNFLAAWGWGVADGSSSSQVCTSGCQAGLPGSGAGQFEYPKFIEVDNSGSSPGDVYVGDTANGVVERFHPDGTLVASWGAGGAMSFSSGGAIGGFAVGVHGDLFVLTLNPP